ncbi:MAG: glycosyl transferase family 2 [Naasia sp.]|jgi:glycosyltransferase involved in cell wall biosynthesis|uniref:glycosyltransferase family 2 protein n=1 Tax=Naasia sp. TaxID=2546198 RepID=UPI00260170E7|nr:glycosyltransferase family 2 protein [Naasia sp.]MCU1569322.1 glycosyl transferase family 2 [Naasia sp.]
MEPTARAPVTVAVVIPVKDDATPLARCLRDLGRQSRRADRVIVVDNGSADESRSVAVRAGAVVLAELRPGIPVVAATGYDAVTEELILRIDADTRLPPDWIERVVDAFRDPRLGALSGPGRFYDLPAPLRRLSRPFSALYLGAYVVACGVALGHAPLFGSNLGMRSSAWRSVREDVHRLDPEVHDDLDLSVHLGTRTRLRFSPGLVVGISARPFFDRVALARRFRRGLHTIVLHWPDELPPYRLSRALRRRRGSARAHPREPAGE